ncbi:hypothetical protein B0O80DRAFT_290969 [Mortierella sp. GBAus27b]|nr:hypothetical protein B0O80DRAFT_290969 [Mortierella sp. GBAus27b]
MRTVSLILSASCNLFTLYIVPSRGISASPVAPVAPVGDTAAECARTAWFHGFRNTAGTTAPPAWLVSTCTVSTSTHRRNKEDHKLVHPPHPRARSIYLCCSHHSNSPVVHITPILQVTGGIGARPEGCSGGC